MGRVTVNYAAVAAALGHNARVEAGMHPTAEKVVADARRLAPKATGAGAASIHAELVDGEWRVSWDQEHAYMEHAEFGTQHQPATPFLRPAADQFTNNHR